VWWGGGFSGGDETRLDAGWLEEIVRRHTIRAALVGIALSVAFFLLAYFIGQRRLMICPVLLLAICLPLLVLGLVKQAVRGARGPLHCPRCGASEKELPGFERTHPQSVSYDVVRCKSCGVEWTDRK
jgi:hypothetical protein